MSDPEHALLTQIKQTGLPEPTPQHRIVPHQGAGVGFPQAHTSTDNEGTCPHLAIKRRDLWIALATDLWREIIVDIPLTLPL